MFIPRKEAPSVAYHVTGFFIRSLKEISTFCFSCYSASFTCVLRAGSFSRIMVKTPREAPARPMIWKQPRHPNWLIVRMLRLLNALPRYGAEVRNPYTVDIFLSGIASETMLNINGSHAAYETPSMKRQNAKTTSESIEPVAKVARLHTKVARPIILMRFALSTS